MQSNSKYSAFLKQHGFPLAEINPGSIEMALSVQDAFKALGILREVHSKILGGDILSKKDGRLIYAYQLWGSQYHYLNWYCNRKADESEDEYIDRSYKLAEEAITKARSVADVLGKECYLVFVLR